MYAPYDIGEELWVFQRPSVAEMKHQYEEMVARINNGDHQVPIKSNNMEKIMYLRRKRFLQDQVPTQDKRPKVFSRFSLSIPLTLKLKEVEPEKEESPRDSSANTKRVESVEEWWGDFHSHNMNIKYLIQLGSLSIGDQAIIELSSKLNDLISKMPGKPCVPALDISWNDIYEEGMVAFSSTLEKLTGLTDVRMDGNQMGTPGLEGMLNALTRAQPQEKKRSAGSFQKMNNGGVVGSPSNSPFGSPVWKRAAPSNLPGISLTLRETNLGDDSTPCLASFLKPLPDNKRLNLVSLDLTNTYIFDGITEITLALHQNTTLTSLTLNSNMIGDQGAFAIGELLLANRTLTKLDIRNCDIGPTGTSHLCEGLQGHKGLREELEREGAVFTIDVGLNPWEFSGELLLLQTAIAKPKMVINWREGDWTPQDDDELGNLIRAFGETTIMERVMDGKGLLPLASPTQLIESPLIASYAPIHIATIVDALNPLTPSKTPSAHLTHDTHALAILNTVLLLMQVHGRTNFKSWMAVLPTILAHLCAWMDPKLLTSSSFRRQIEVRTLDLLGVLGHVNQQIIEDIVVRSGIISTCLDNFLAFPNHNVFHLHLIKLVEGICNNTICGTLRTHTLGLLTGDFYNRLLIVIKEQSSLSVRARNGSFSAALLFVRVIEPFLETRLALQIKKLTKLHDDEHKGSLGGPPPERGKQKIVLNKDAEI